ncbi:glycosyltransferase family 2 protein [Parabacteroides goldsteinii]|uniref:glycosyltransferase family 2 protein n=1 Tax=Parabacteroides goldsteinii TaxID=328812 RepID=UPI0034A177E5
MDKVKVLVIIVTYNAMEWIDRCINSILRSSVSSDIYLIDNGSTDGTQEYILHNYPQVIFVQSISNQGFGQANNLGLRYALECNYDYVYLLNQDAWVMPDTLEKLIVINQKKTEYGVLSPFQLQGNALNMDVNFAMYICSYKSNSFLINDLYFNRRQDVYEVPDVMAAHWLISSNCLRRVGGFSPTFPHYGEDVNYANRVMYHGFKLGIVPDTIAVHDRESRKGLTLEQKRYRAYLNALVTLSNIYKPEAYPFFKMTMRLFVAILRLRSIRLLGYYFKILGDYSSIHHNMRISKGEAAFLQE